MQYTLTTRLSPCRLEDTERHPDLLAFGQDVFNFGHDALVLSLRVIPNIILSFPFGAL